MAKVYMSMSNEYEAGDQGKLYLSNSDLAHLFTQGNASFAPAPGGSLRCSQAVPHPVVARDDVFMVHIDADLRASGQAQALADPDASEVAICRAVQAMYAHHPQASMAQWSDLYRAVYATVGVAFPARQGRILRATDGLEAMLMHTSMEASLPTALFKPPHPATYVHFGPLWREKISALLGPALALTGAKAGEATAHGCYLFQTRSDCPHCGQNRRVIGLYLVVELHDHPGLYSICGGADEVLHDEDAPLEETLVSKLNAGVPGGLFGVLPGALVSLLAKLFLYLQADAARVVQHNDHTALSKRLGQVGSKKIGKLQRRSERLYDWTEAGPLNAPVGLHHGELPPHWRRGHLRHQPHGPHHSLRKLIFIMPTLVRSDRFHGTDAAEKPTASV